ncbi:MAG: hypothetical protein JW751_21930 [Polyangiaceae bacterium]|nr:hypothetical protein [Polyangiaceae bacterium]
MKTSERIPESFESAGEPAIVGQVLRLFHERLAEVVFPGVSATALMERTATLAERQAAMAAARAELRAAECALAAERRALVELAERAVAYAKVYAVGDPELETALEALGLQRPNRAKQKPEQKSRPRQGRRSASPAQTSLPAPAPGSMLSATAPVGVAVTADRSH